MTEASSTAVATTAKRTQPTLRDLLLAARPKLGEVCARHLPPDRLVRLTVAAVSRTPGLLECSPETVLSSVFVAGRLGLEPDGVLGSAYLVPFFNKKTDRKECQLIVGYRGLVDLASRSGKVKAITSRVVHAKDRFRVSLGTDEGLKHVPSDDENPGELTHVYAVATLADGTKQFEVMSRRQIDGIKNRSKAAGFGPWVTDFEEMARKTVIRRLSKALPLSTEFAAALTLQAGAEGGEDNVARVVDDLGISMTDAPAAIEGGTAPTGEGAPEAPRSAKETLEEKRAKAKAALSAAAPTTPASEVKS